MHRVFGIRHHGPGCARSLREALAAYQPDAILIEGPTEGDALIPLAADAAMRPPVAMLFYAVEQPQQAGFYPFAAFSPEWQALRYALDAQVPVRFFDLPQTHRLALEEAEPDSEAGADEEGEAGAGARADATDYSGADASEASDPWWDLARAGGFADPEALWDRLVEQREDSGELFAAIAELMQVLRDAREVPRDDLVREAWMRKELRTEIKAGRQRIAVVCGAFHAPVLIDLPPVKADNELLKNLPKLKVGATWVPWTYGRLTRASGYGAGVASPGWYEHLWTRPPARTAAWMSRAAAIFREHDLDISPAHAIEATRLAETLAALRGKPQPALAEVEEAIQTIYCFGDPLPLRLVHEKLSVGERLGEVPASAPEPPLVADLRAQQKRLRLAAEASRKTVDLDLRKETDLARSQLLHRLSILGVSWGTLQDSQNGRGTFHELWSLAWQPELALALIEAGRYGNRVEDAACECLRARAAQCAQLAELAAMLAAALKAALNRVVDPIIRQLDDLAAASADIPELMQAFAHLAPIARYGDVRKTDTAALQRMLLHYLERICIGLPLACAHINDDAAPPLFACVNEMDQALRLLDLQPAGRDWCEALQRLVDGQGVHPLLAGRATRILLDQAALCAEDAARRLGLALSPGVAPQQAAWLEGFLAGTGLLLVHQPQLLALLDAWLCGLKDETFQEVLPLVRRAFAQFAHSERRQIAGRIADGLDQAPGTSSEAGVDYDWSRARLVVPLLEQLYGIRVDT